MIRNVQWRREEWREGDVDMDWIYYNFWVNSTLDRVGGAGGVQESALNFLRLH